MDDEMEVEVFRAGDYGARGAYSEEELEGIAADYSAEIHEAPVTVDHRQDGPALGWVRGLRRRGAVLLARLGGLNEDFLGKLKAGAFKKRSVELYRAAEATGRPYLRALTFLGAGAPAVKGLADPVFAESGDCARIEFAEEQKAPEASGDETTVAEAPAASSAAFDEAARSESLETKASKTSEESPRRFTETDKTADEADKADVAKFCDRLRQSGRLLPLWEERGLREFLASLDDEQAERFGVSEASASTTQRGWFRDFLEGMAPVAPVVPMGEAAAVALDNPTAAGKATPSNTRGVRFDDESVALHERVCRYRGAHPEALYSEALQAVASEF